MYNLKVLTVIANGHVHILCISIYTLENYQIMKSLDMHLKIRNVVFITSSNVLLNKHPRYACMLVPGTKKDDQ